LPSLPPSVPITTSDIQLSSTADGAEVNASLLEEISEGISTEFENNEYVVEGTAGSRRRHLAVVQKGAYSDLFVVKNITSYVSDEECTTFPSCVVIATDVIIEHYAKEYPESRVALTANLMAQNYFEKVPEKVTQNNPPKQTRGNVTVEICGVEERDMSADEKGVFESSSQSFLEPYLLALDIPVQIQETSVLSVEIIPNGCENTASRRRRVLQSSSSKAIVNVEVVGSHIAAEEDAPDLSKECQVVVEEKDDEFVDDLVQESKETGVQYFENVVAEPDPTPAPTVVVIASTPSPLATTHDDDSAVGSVFVATNYFVSVFVVLSVASWSLLLL
jgi:hypothetical protein